MIGTCFPELEAKITQDFLEVNLLSWIMYSECPQCLNFPDLISKCTLVGKHLTQLAWLLFNIFQEYSCWKQSAFQNFRIIYFEIPVQNGKPEINFRKNFPQPLKCLSLVSDTHLNFQKQPNVIMCLSYSFKIASNNRINSIPLRWNIYTSVSTKQRQIRLK